MIRRTPTSGRAAGVVEAARGRDRRSWGILAGRICTRIVHLTGGGRKCRMTPFIEGDISARQNYRTRMTVLRNDDVSLVRFVGVG